MSEASEAAEQVVRMMLSGGEIAVRLSGSALKNGAALLLALAKNHKNVFGKINLSKMLGMTRDIRTFALTPEQYIKVGYDLATKPQQHYVINLYFSSFFR